MDASVLTPRQEDRCCSAQKQEVWQNIAGHREIGDSLGPKAHSTPACRLPTRASLAAPVHYAHLYITATDGEMRIRIRNPRELWVPVVGI